MNNKEYNSNKEFLDRLSDKDINSLIDELCKVRSDNPDVQIIDNIEIYESLNKTSDEDVVNEDIMRSIFENNSTPISQEEMNALKANGIYNKYLAKKYNNQQEDNEMNSVEEEIRRSLEQESTVNEDMVTEIVSDEEVPEQSFQEEVKPSDEVNIVIENNDIDKVKEDSKQSVIVCASPTFIAGTVQPYVSGTLEEVVTEFNDTMDKVVSGKVITEAIEEVNENTITTDDEERMTIEEINNLPPTELSVPGNVIVSSLKEQYNTVSDEDAFKLIDVMNRYKSGEKFNVFEALPDSLKQVINAEAMTAGIDKSLINFFAKSFINDLVNNTYLDKEIKDFNKELKETLAPMNNIVGTVMDEYSDDIYNKFTKQLENKANEIEDSDPEKAKELRDISSVFKEAVSLDRIIDSITKTPSNINKAYKTARDRWTNYNKEYKEKISKVDPSPRNLDYITMGLTSKDWGYGEYNADYIKTLAILVTNSIIEALSVENLTEHIYAYYLSNAVYTIAFSANNSEVTKITIDSLKLIFEKINDYMLPLLTRKNKKNRKRRKK